MREQYTVFKDIIIFIFVWIFIGIIGGCFLEDIFRDMWSYIILATVAIGIILILFKDYKIVLSNQTVELYGLFMNRKVMIDNIIKIKISTPEYYSIAIGARKKMYIYTNEEVYSFNIEALYSRTFFEQLKEITNNYNIELIININT